MVRFGLIVTSFVGKLMRQPALSSEDLNHSITSNIQVNLKYRLALHGRNLPARKGVGMEELENQPTIAQVTRRTPLRRNTLACP